MSCLLSAVQIKTKHQLGLLFGLHTRSETIHICSLVNHTAPYCPLPVTITFCSFTRMCILSLGPEWTWGNYWKKEAEQLCVHPCEKSWIILYLLLVNACKCPAYKVTIWSFSNTHLPLYLKALLMVSRQCITCIFRGVQVSSTCGRWVRTEYGQFTSRRPFPQQAHVTKPSGEAPRWEYFGFMCNPVASTSSSACVVLIISTYSCRTFSNLHDKEALSGGGLLQNLSHKKLCWLHSGYFTSSMKTWCCYVSFSMIELGRRLWLQSGALS